MEPNLFLETDQPATLADISAIEQQYGFTLPDDYKQHILAHNGGFPQRETFIEIDPDGDQIERDVNYFYSVRYGVSTLERTLELLADQIHSDLVPFANDAGGDQFLLSVGPKDYGSVYYLSHEFYTPPEDENEEDTDEPTAPTPLDYGSGVHFLAPSFTAFLDGLVEGTPV